MQSVFGEPPPKNCGGTGCFEVQSDPDPDSPPSVLSEWTNNQYLGSNLLRPGELVQRAIDGTLKSTDVVCDLHYQLLLFIGHTTEIYCRADAPLYDALGQPVVTYDELGRAIPVCEVAYYLKQVDVVLTVVGATRSKTCRSVCEVVPSVPACPCVSPPAAEMVLSPQPDTPEKYCAPTGKRSVTFDGRATPAPGSGPLTYSWSVTSPTTSARTADTSRLEVVLDRGRYTATFTVRDESHGCSSSTTRAVLVDGPPQAEITSPAEGATFAIDEIVKVSATAKDQESSNTEPLRVSWQLFRLDGSPTPPLTPQNEGSPDQPMFSGKMDPGEYRADLTIEDSCGSQSKVSRSFKVDAQRFRCPASSLLLSQAKRSGLDGTAFSMDGSERGGSISAGLALRVTPKFGCSRNGTSCESCENGGCEDQAGKPVFLATGVLAEYHSDLGWPVAGGHLHFERAYLSSRTRSGQLGAGWSHSFETFLDVGATGASVRDWRGGTLLFSRNAAGSYTAADGSGVSLTHDSNDVWVLQYALGGQLRFRADGKLAEMRDSNGNTFAMVYSGSGDLIRVVDPAGGALELEVVGGLIRSATAKNGDRVQFAYTADRRLAVATSQAGHATSYGYAATTGLLRTIARPGNGLGALTQEIEYNANRQVMRITATAGDGSTSVNAFAYPDASTRIVTAADGQTYAFKLNAAGRVVERSDANGDTYRIDLDAADRTTRRTYPDGTSERWTYDSEGRLSSYISRNNEVTRVERSPDTGAPTALVRVSGGREEREGRAYDAKGNLVRSRDAVGAETVYTRDSRGLITEVRGPGGAVAKYEYDAAGNLSKVMDAAGQSTTYQRDGLGREIAVTTPGGRTTRTEYCTCGQVSATIDPEGNRTEYEYDAMGDLVKTKLPNGGTIENTYIRRNGFSLVASVKDALGNVSRTEYDAVGRVVAQVDALGRRTTYELDVIGRVVKVKLPGGGFSITRYNQAGRVSETENARGAVTRYLYDADGRLLSTTLADGSSSSQQYDGVGRVVKRVNADGAVEQLVYDAAGRVIATIDALGHLARTEYNPTGTVKKTINVRDKATSFEYDALDRLVKTTNTLGFTTKQEYSADGEVTLSVNARGAETRFKFDRAGRLVETTDALGGKVKKQFDSIGNVVRVEDENGHAWTFAYDLSGRRTRETDPNGKSSQYTFNALELVKVRQADGAEWEYTRDAAGRVIRRVLRNAAGVVEDVETFTYDIVGNRIKAENGAVVVTSEFDIMDREVKRVTTWKKTGAVRELRFTHDAMGRRQSMGDTHGRVTLYQYDKLSRPVKLVVLEPNPRATGVADSFVPREYRFEWDAGSNLVEVAYPNGTRTRREVDDIDRLTKIVHQRVVDAGEPEVLASWTIERDASGNPTRVVREDGEEWKYEHDPLDRLVKAQLPRELVERLRAQDQAKGPEKPDEDPAERLMKAGEIAYRYDAAGNRVEENYAGRLIASTYGPANEMLTRGNMSFSYDPRGNQTEKRFKSGNRQVFSYSSAGKLAALASGNENAKRAEDQLKILERYLYSPDGERVLVEDVQGKKLQHALWDGSRQIEEWHEVAHGAGKKEKGLLYTRDLGGQLLEQAGFERMNGRTANALQEGDADDGDKFAHVRWVAPDFLGSTALVTNRGGRVLDGQTFGPWGENIEGNRNKIRFGYTGHAWESQTGHWSALYRELDPRVGRWSQRDPLGTIDGQNRYGYVRQSPVTLTDPTGLIATRGERPTWLQQAINELAADVGPPFDSKCKQFPKCKICPSCPYNYLLRYSGSSIILDFTRPGRGADYAEVEPGVPAVIRIDGSLVRTGKEKFKEVLLHELTHICTIANMNRGGRVKHWEDPFRWMVFVRGDQAEGVKTFWAGLGPCDPCPDPPFTVKDL